MAEPAPGVLAGEMVAKEGGEGMLLCTLCLQTFYAPEPGLHYNTTAEKVFCLSASCYLVKGNAVNVFTLANITVSKLLRVSDRRDLLTAYHIICDYVIM